MAQAVVTAAPVPAIVVDAIVPPLAAVTVDAVMAHLVAHPMLALLVGWRIVAPAARLRDCRNGDDAGRSERNQSFPVAAYMLDSSLGLGIWRSKMPPRRSTFQLDLGRVGLAPNNALTARRERADGVHRAVDEPVLRRGPSSARVTRHSRVGRVRKWLRVRRGVHYARRACAGRDRRCSSPPPVWARSLLIGHGRAGIALIVCIDCHVRRRDGQRDRQPDERIAKPQATASA
jgi:hypothetical protein